ncbi:hypothetical protein ACP_3257 [Acidobacterium capsulatum ATCC 51196]|uniref:Uncharacterized protein n=1 Tax=Acidobacterium capsulatum (strain ATCC 51196 / DSM 11244 / BCRC 80197 / JCM 7670 / NBRC 15755 / NCIMB 13165 / 161) TaxID=240015 RepID=C1F5S2_ACIC5|nr:hypothetical protein ACP_3257 [Acidobacterium capsulatum ATCC 51196]
MTSRVGLLPGLALMRGGGVVLSLVLLHLLPEPLILLLFP